MQVWWVVEYDAPTPAIDISRFCKNHRVSKLKRFGIQVSRFQINHIWVSGRSLCFS